MIWQLMKLDPAWVWTALLTLASVFFCALGGSFVVGALLLFSCGVAATQSVDEALYASLPVTPRQVWLEKTLAVTVMLWLPLSFPGSMLTQGRSASASPASVIALGSVLMLALQLVQRAKFRRQNVPGWLIGVPVLIWLASSYVPALPGVITKWQGWVFRESAGMAIPVIVTSWTLTGIIFLTVFLTAPNAFLLGRAAGKPNAEAHAVAREKRDGIIRLLSLIRIFLSSSHLWILYSLAGLLALSDGLSFAFYILFLSLPNGIGRKFQWMSFLPVPPSAVLAGILLPSLVALVAGYEIAVRVPFDWLSLFTGAAGLRPAPGFRDQAGTIMILAMVTMTLTSLAYNLKKGRARAVTRVVSMLGCVVLLSCRRPVSVLVTASLPVAIALGAIALVLLYWMLDALFRRSEFVDKPLAGDLA